MHVYLLLNLRSPRDCGSCRPRLWYFLSPLDGTSVHEAHCVQASTAVRRTEAPCAQASTAVRSFWCNGTRMIFDTTINNVSC